MDRIVAKNPTAYHNYYINDKLEAGIVLSGTEIKSIRKNKVNLKDSYINIKNGEIFAIGIHISPYEFGNRYNLDPIRTRKLLLNKREINKLYGKVKQQGLSLVPISMYFKGNIIKLEIGIGKGKKNYDKRAEIAKKDAEMKIRRSLKNNF
ncbi:MAG: SsrA-binding protein SmpB [Clostridia bacterium]|nr:SsrA-binding protein SmpB [Clostridia bacterium]